MNENQIAQEGEDEVSKDTGCSLHPSCLTCPEPICVFDFKGGLNAYLRYKEMREILEQGYDIDEAAKILHVHKSTIQRRFVSGNEKVKVKS